MRLVLTTRHRRMVIVTGDDVALEDDTETYVSNTGAQLDIPAVEEPVYEETEDRFGFRG